MKISKIMSAALVLTVLAGCLSGTEQFGSKAVADVSVGSQAEQGDFSFEFKEIRVNDSENGDDKVKIAAYVVTSVNGSGSELVIPNEWEGLPVVAVTADFLGDQNEFKDIETIVFPENFAGICEWRLDYEPGEYSVNGMAEFTDGIDRFGLMDGGIRSFANYYEGSFKEYKVDGENPYYSVQDGVLMSKSGSILISVPAGKEGEYEIPENVKHIAAHAFMNSHLKKLVIHKDISLECGLIGSGDAGLLYSDVVLDETPYKQDFSDDNASDMGVYRDGFVWKWHDNDIYCAFAFASELEDISVAENNAQLYTENGCLVKRETRLGELKAISGDGYITWDTENREIIDQNVLLWCPPTYSDKVFDIPEDINAVAGYAFQHSDSIETINVPDNVLFIHTNAFAFCDELKEINITGRYSTKDYLSMCIVGYGGGAPYPIYSGISASIACGSPKLEKITVQSEELFNDEAKLSSSVFEADDNILYQTYPGTENGNWLLQYFPQNNNRVYIVPEGFEYVSPYAFSDAQDLKYIVIPKDTQFGSGFLAMGAAVHGGIGSNITLIVSKDSPAESFAKDNGIKYLYELPKDAYDTPEEPSDSHNVKGDINGDNVINVKDSVLVTAFAKQVKAPTEEQKKAADVNGDGVVNVKDSVLVTGAAKNVKPLA